jgi:hypothetical protein
MPKMREQWTLEDLWRDLEEFERALTAAALSITEDPPPQTCHGLRPFDVMALDYGR